MRSAGALLALALIGAAPPAFAHEATAEVNRDGRWPSRPGPTAAMSWGTAGRGVLPRRPAIPFWKGRTDRNGWVAFVPDAPGAGASGWWTRPGTASSPSWTSGPRSDRARTGIRPAASTRAFALRPLVGVALVAAIFGLLYLRGRRKIP